MKHKLVINKCYGGFSLSLKALADYYKRKHSDSEVYFYLRKYNRDGNVEYIKCSAENADIVLSEDFGNKVLIDRSSDLFFQHVISDCDMPRYDKDLIDVVETLGDEANGRFAELQVVEIDDDRYRIIEYDGLESVETPSSIAWSTFD